MFVKTYRIRFVVIYSRHNIAISNVADLQYVIFVYKIFLIKL